ncbi:IucA/IucC family protein [Acinetobacter sp. WZC-1]|uniref:IucA/IucC family protein n=1 Tax=Acinetobacter sp. WZC-1 TaxID=3459034 RepID=UPI00403E24CC
MNQIIATDTWSTKIFEQYLNTFFRELQVNLQDHLIPSVDSPLASPDHSDAYYFSYPFKASAQTVHGIIRHLSTTGYHQYHPFFGLSGKNGHTFQNMDDPELLIKIITDELTALFKDRSQNTNLHAEIRNSIENTQFFLKNRPQQTALRSPHLSFQAAEQSMMFGHPFHVTSKANLGFTQQDMKKYSPELAAVFQLHYFAVQHSLVKTLKSKSDFQIPYEDAVLKKAKEVLGDRLENYDLLPVHPWQAGFLLQHSELKQYLDDQQVIPLGAVGQMVWPTSSVRTVWLPESLLFLKLSIDVRITSFIRNNPLDEMERAIDASKIILDHQINQQYSSLMILPELEAKTVNIAGLESAFGIIYRAGLTTDVLENTRMLGGLLEDNGRDELPLVKFIHQAAQHQGIQNADLKQFIPEWWAQYLKVSLIPLLELFASKGISVEAHLQNSLMEFSNGMPNRLIIRDMEGISVVAAMLGTDRFTRISEAPIGQDSSVWFSEQDAWIFLKYYLVINHIAHVISALARSTAVEEITLWQTTRHVLKHETFTDQGRYYRDLLLNSVSLPIKANMLNTLYHTGGNPVWIEIDNPLYQYRGLTDLTPLQQENSPATSQKAEQRVIGQLLEALIFEHAVKYELVGNQIKFFISAHVFYSASATRHFSFKRIKILTSTLSRTDVNENTITPVSLKQVLADLKNIVEADPLKWQNFCDELYQTYVKHDQTLGSTPHQPLRTLSYFEQEARVNNAHLYHPSFKSRIGFDLHENKKYAPELSEGFQVKWTAIHRSLCKIVLSSSLNLDQLYKQQFSSQQLKNIHHELSRHKLDHNHLSLNDYILMPIHPWQWDKIIAIYYHDAIKQQLIIPLESRGPDYLPQQSIRTLSNITDITAFSLKLSMNLVNTSTSRVLAPHTVQNAAKMSDWLAKIVADDQVLNPAHKPVILREIAGISVQQQIALPVQYGALACIWRESIYHYLKDGESATPVTGLMQVDTDGKPVIDDWIRQYGPDFWLKHLFQHVYLPIMHILWSHGLALESHAQNMLLVHKEGLPIKAALKDFHDGIRFSRHLLREPQLLPQLQDAPQEHAKINPNSFLETHSPDELRDFTQDALWFVNLAELSIFLNQHYDYEEIRFWTLLRTTIDEHKAAHPEFSDRYALFNFTDDTMDIEQLASRRFLPEIRLRVQTIQNPLSFIQEFEYE